MRDIGGKLPAKRLALLTLGHVHQQDDRADGAAAGRDAVCNDLPCDGLARQKHLGVVSGERRVHSAQKLRDMAHGTKIAERVAVRLEGEKLHGALVAGEDARPPVEQQKALAHIFGDGGEFTLAQTQLIELAAAGALKLLNAADQRRKLFIARIRNGIVQIDGVDRPCDLLGKAIRQHAA